MAICAETKLIPSWLVGERTTEDCMAFLADLKDRMAGRIQLSTDGHQTYRASVPYIFGPNDIDWAQLHKLYRSQQTAPGRYSPPACIGAEKKRRLGNPDPEKISTSYVERQNLTMRMPAGGSRTQQGANCMARVNPYHTSLKESPPERDVYHNDDACSAGSKIKKEHWKSGKDGRPLCKDCK